MNKWPGLLVTTLGLAVAAGNAQAELAAVDPGPYTPATGNFPLWYRDSNNLALELCQSRAVSPTVPAGPDGPAYLCTILPEPGLFDDSLPMIYPDNWPTELFWFLAETDIPEGDVDGYELEVYIAAIEAAFAGEDPKVDGDQQSFARIRIRASVPVAGTYTITHPYGVETIEVTEPGRRAINLTRDLGIGAPGDFTGALGGDVGPFLTRADGTRVTVLNPETGASETFIGDPNVPTTVTGSPNDTNFVRIAGPAGVIETSQFILSGKLLDSRPPTPLAVERSSYRRTAEGTRIEVFANSTDTDATACYRDTLELVDGTPPSPCLVNLTPDNNGYFFASASTQTLPPFVVVTASDPSGTNKPTSVSSRLSDIVKIRSARYSWEDRTLTLEASSSDEVQVPDLAAEGFGRLARSGTLQTLTVRDLAQPPASITVKSAAGGADTALVTVVGSAPVAGPNQPPLAQNDSASTSAGVPVTIAVLANDSDPDNDTPLRVIEPALQEGALGSIALSGSTQVTYTPPTAVPAEGLTETFTYRVEDARGARSEPATVTVSVSANQAPVAAPDSAAAIGNGTPVVIDVLANDSDPEGNLPLTIVNLGTPVGGGSVAIVQAADGTQQLSYSPPTGVTTAFTATFTYQAQDSLGAVSDSATVSVAVAPVAAVENLAIQSAIAKEKSRNRWTWELRGSTDVLAGNSIELRADTTLGEVVLGTATPTGNGNWRFTLNNSANRIPQEGGSVTATSRNGTTATLPLVIERR